MEGTGGAVEEGRRGVEEAAGAMEVGRGAVDAVSGRRIRTTADGCNHLLY